ncbi:MAG: hypothetical protein P8X55_15895 [Desulfosarcinaceae bacterium]
MTRPSEYDTPTMAKIYAEQGYLRKAAGIYRRLLTRHPQRQDLRSALADLEEKLSRQKGPSRKELGLLLREWRDLMLGPDHKQLAGYMRPPRRNQKMRGEEDDG